MCGCAAASPIDSTGAKHASLPSSNAHHSARVFCLKSARELLLERGPVRAVHLRRQAARVDAELAQQLGVELRLDRADRDVLAVLGLVGVVEGRAAVEQVRAALLGLQARRAEAEEHRHQQRAPSTIAASTTWPWPERCASSSAQTMPNASSMPPPPKSPTRLSGGTGASPARPIACSAPVSAM